MERTVTEVETHRGAYGAKIRTAPISAEKIGTERICCDAISTERIVTESIGTERISAGKISAEPIVTLPTVPHTRRAAVYRGVDDVRVETVPLPLDGGAGDPLGQGEVLLRIDTGGICGTELAKVNSGASRGAEY